MINFFRKKRKKLADNNKALKYMRYAIGEIVLVVIGILIALQINTWNEESRNKRVERAFYTDVLDDLKNDIEKLDNQTFYYKNRIENLGWLLQKIRNPNLEINPIEFGKRIEPLYYDNKAISYASTFDASKSSGTFISFKNKELLKNLTQYYANFDELEGRINSTSSFIGNQLEPMMFTLPLNYLTAETNELVITSEGDSNSGLYKFIASYEDKRNLNLDIKTFIQKSGFENYVIGDLGRSFNVISSIERRKMRTLEISNKIKLFLND